MPRFATVEDLRRLETTLLGRTNIRPRSITEDRLAVGAASAAVVRDGTISDVHIGTLTLGALTVSGTMQSSNYSATPGAEAGWQINADGTINAYQLDVIGSIAGGTIDIGGDDASSFHVDVSGNMWLGAGLGGFATAPFRVTNAGALNIGNGNFTVSVLGAVVATSATITGALTAGAGSDVPATFLTTGTTAANLTIDTGGWIRSGNWASQSAGWSISNTAVEINQGTLDIGGADATSWHVDADGNMWSGAGTFGSADFRVSNAGVMTVDHLNLSGSTGVVFDQSGVNARISFDGTDTITYNVGDDSLSTKHEFKVTAGQSSVDGEGTVVFTVEGHGSTEEKVQIHAGSETGLSLDDGWLLILPETGAHLSFDTDEIQAKHSSTGAGDLNLNVHGGDINVSGAAGGDFLFGGATGQQQAKFENNSESTFTVEIINHADVGTFNPDGLRIDLGSDADDPGTADRYIVFRKGDGTVVGKITGDGSGDMEFDGLRSLGTGLPNANFGGTVEYLTYDTSDGSLGYSTI